MDLNGRDKVNYKDEMVREDSKIGFGCFAGDSIV